MCGCVLFALRIVFQGCAVNATPNKLRSELDSRRTPPSLRQGQGGLRLGTTTGNEGRLNPDCWKCDTYCSASRGTVVRQLSFFHDNVPVTLEMDLDDAGNMSSA